MVWTKHFTRFITFSQSSPPPTPGGGGGGGYSTPKVSEVFPKKDDSGVEPDVIITALFDMDVEVADLAKITIQDSRGNKIGGVTAVLNGLKIIINHDKFAYLTKYTVTIPENAVKGNNGGKFNGEISWSFTTRDKDISFTDLPKNHWALEDISKLRRLNIIHGYPDNTFRPDSNITRAEFTVILTKALGIPGQGSGDPVFPDVPGTAWYFECVQAMAKAGLVKGYEGKFNPGELITRQEMAVMLANALKGKGSTATFESMVFSDVDKIAPWARDSVASAVEEGLMRGYPDGTFGPHGYATRAEVCSVTCRLLGKNDKTSRE